VWPPLPEFCYDPQKGLFRNFLLTIVHRKSLNQKKALQNREARHVFPDTPLESAAREEQDHA